MPCHHMEFGQSYFNPIPVNSFFAYFPNDVKVHKIDNFGIEINMDIMEACYLGLMN